MCYHLCCSRIGTVGVNVQKTVLSMQRVTLNMCSGGECESECVNESLCVCVGVCATSCSPATASCFKARRAFLEGPSGWVRREVVVAAGGERRRGGEDQD